MNLNLTADPRTLLRMWRLMGQLDGIMPFKSALPHPVTEYAQQNIVTPVIQTNRSFYSEQDTAIQAAAGVATSVFQTAFRMLAGVADMAGAMVTETPNRSIRGIFADTLNMIFVLGTRAARMTIRGAEGSSVFDRTLAIADLITEAALVIETLRGAGRGISGAGRFLDARARRLSQRMEAHSTPAEAFADGGLMMASDDRPASGGKTAGEAADVATLIKAAKNEEAARHLLRRLIEDTPDAIRPDQLPHLIEIARSNPEIMMALNELCDLRHDLAPIILAEIIEAVKANSEVAARGLCDLAHDSSHLFTHEHVLALFEAFKIRKEALNALRNLCIGRNDLAPVILQSMIEAAQTSSDAVSNLHFLATVKKSLFTPEFTLQLHRAATINPEIQSVIDILDRHRKP